MSRTLLASLVILTSLLGGFSAWADSALTPAQISLLNSVDRDWNAGVFLDGAWASKELETLIQLEEIVAEPEKLNVSEMKQLVTSLGAAIRRGPTPEFIEHAKTSIQRLRTWGLGAGGASSPLLKIAILSTPNPLSEVSDLDELQLLVFRQSTFSSIFLDSLKSMQSLSISLMDEPGLVPDPKIAATLIAQTISRLREILSLSLITGKNVRLMESAVRNALGYIRISVIDRFTERDVSPAALRSINSSPSFDQIRVFQNVLKLQWNFFSTLFIEEDPDSFRDQQIRLHTKTTELCSSLFDLISPAE